MTEVYRRDHPVRRLLVAAIHYLVHSNVFISLSATSVAVTTIVLADLPLEVLPLFIVFAVSLFVYSFNRIADYAEDKQNVPERAAFVETYGKALLAVGTVLYAIASVIAFARGLPRAPALVIPLAVAVLYSVVGVKQILLLKNLLVGLSWGLIPLGVGVYFAALWTVDILFMFAFITVMLTIAAAVFDIKDIEGDQAEGIATVPIMLGPASTRRLAAGATVLVGIATAGLILGGILDGSYALLFAFLVYVFGYSLVATRDRTTLFYGFVIDGEHIFLAILVLGYEALPSLI